MMAGSLLGGYRIVDELSSGGMGTVYRARHELLGRLAAVKLLRPELTSNPELVQRFWNEARAATAIRHPGIIEVFDFGYTDDGRAYYVMELLDGESLGHRIDTRGKLPEHEAARLGRGIASALAAAHAQGIVHRDLKPDNVFVVPDPEVGERTKVLDFGIAKLVDPSGAALGSSHTLTGSLIGTPRYMAPEQARAAAAIDHRADLYSLGCILYELVVGEPPFAAGGAGEVIAMQMFGDVVRPGARGIAITPAFEAIIVRLLAKEPADRFQSAAEVADTLTSAFDLRPSMPLPAASPRRRAVLPIALGLVALAIAGGVAFLVLGGHRDDRPPPAPPPQPAVALPVRKPAPPPPPPPPAPPPAKQPAPAAPAAAPSPKKPVVPRTPPKSSPCDDRMGPHTDNCSPIEPGL